MPGHFIPTRTPAIAATSAVESIVVNGSYAYEFLIIGLIVLILIGVVFYARARSHSEPG